MKIKNQRKMKKSQYKPGILLITALCFLSLTLSAQEELTKDFHKEYTVQKGTKLDLSNRYGDIVVETSETNQVVIDVKVTVKHPNRERAQKLLSYIDIQFAEGGNVISAKTKIDDKFNFTGWGGDSRRFRIDYNVKMPVEMDLALANLYGDTQLDDLSGYLEIDVKYGNLSASKLSRGSEKPVSVIYVAYGNGTIDEAGWLDVTTRYSGNFSVDKGQALLLDSKYSKVQLGSVGSVVGDVRYNNLRIDKINNLVLDAGYTDINVGTLSKKLVLDGGYGAFNADNVPAGFESLEVNTHYTGVRLGIDESASFNLEAKTSYCGLKYNEDNFQNRKRIVENNSSEISGIVGKDSSPVSKVKVDASYGSVKLY
jgi:hypothetical protein